MCAFYLGTKWSKVETLRWIKYFYIYSAVPFKLKKQARVSCCLQHHYAPLGPFLYSFIYCWLGSIVEGYGGKVYGKWTVQQRPLKEITLIEEICENLLAKIQVLSIRQTDRQTDRQQQQRPRCLHFKYSTHMLSISLEAICLHHLSRARLPCDSYWEARKGWDVAVPLGLVKVWHWSESWGWYFKVANTHLCVSGLLTAVILWLPAEL